MRIQVLPAQTPTRDRREAHPRPPIVEATEAVQPMPKLAEPTIEEPPAPRQPDERLVAIIDAITRTRRERLARRQMPREREREPERPPATPDPES